MDDLDDVIGLLNSNKAAAKAKAQFMPAPSSTATIGPNAR